MARGTRKPVQLVVYNEDLKLEKGRRRIAAPLDILYGP